MTSKAGFQTAIGLLFLMAVLAGGSALRESVTFDEVAHVGAGLSYVQKLDMRLNVEHPPLVKILTGAALSASGGRADYQHISWEFSLLPVNSDLGEWVFGNWVVGRWNDAATSMKWARAPMLVLMLALGWVLFRAGSNLGGVWGGLLALAIYSSSPIFLAMGPLVHTDVANALFTVLVTWQVAEFWRDEVRGTWWKFGAVLGGALLSKFSALLLVPICAAFYASMYFFPPDGRKDPSHAVRARRVMLDMTKGFALAASLTYLVYFVFSWNQPSSGLVLSSGSAVPEIVQRLLVPVAVYWNGVTAVSVKLARMTFMMGHVYDHGVWFYFPLLFLLKNTPPFLLLCGLASLVRWLPTARTIRRDNGAEAYSPHWRAVSLFLVVLTVVCLTSRIDIGYRHFSAPAALLMLAISGLPRRVQGIPWARWAVAGLAPASIMCALLAYPNYIPYLNVAANGHPNYWWTNDSNIDWNQALPAVAEFAKGKGLGEILVAETAPNLISAYVRGGRIWNCQEVHAGDPGKWAAISAAEITFGRNCSWLMQFPHEAIAGGAMYAVHLPASVPEAGEPGGPPSPADRWSFRLPATDDPRDGVIRLIDDPALLSRVIR